MQEPSLQSRGLAKREYQWSWIFSGLLCLLLLLTQFLGAGSSLKPGLWLVIVCFELYLPFWRLEHDKLLAAELSAEGLTFRLKKQFFRPFLQAIFGVLIFFPLYILAYHWYMTYGYVYVLKLGAWFPLTKIWFLRGPTVLTTPFSLADFSFPSLGWLSKISLLHLLGVAIPEELFFRGYLQGVFEKRFPPKFSIFKVPLGKGAFLSSLLFGFGHYLATFELARWLTFFPGLLFAWQKNYTRSLLAPVIVHVLCNILGELLAYAYRVHLG